MSQHLVEVENWRDYDSEAPDFILEVYSGQELRISLEDIMKQGAVDIDTFDSPLSAEKDPLYAGKNLSMRGWQYYALVLEQPLRGNVKTDEYAKGLTYTSKSGYIGGDCFNYVLTNGFQQSNVGRVTILVKPWYELRISAELLSPDRYKFTATIITPAGEAIPDFVYYDWAIAGPHESNGRVSYGEFASMWKTSIYRIKWSYVSVRYSGVVCREAYGPYPMKRDTEYSNLIDSTTGVLYVPKDEMPEVILRAKLYVNGRGQNYVDGDIIELETTFSEQVGSKWDKSGVVIDPDTPTQDDLDGILTPTFAAKTSIDNSIHIDSLIPDVN